MIPRKAHLHRHRGFLPPSMRRLLLLPFLLISAVLGCLSAAGVAASPAMAAQPWWGLSASAVPGVLPREGTGRIVVRATNLGDLPVTGSSTPVRITDVLPPGMLATGTYSYQVGYAGGATHGAVACSPTPPATAFPAASVTCTWSEPSALQPYELLEVAIYVQVGSSASTRLENEVQASGGEGVTTEPDGKPTLTPDGTAVAPVSLARPVTVGTGSTPFGIEEYTLTSENEGGSLDTQAGSHPFQQTTSIAFNQVANQIEDKPPALPKDLSFQWPAGLIGNPTALPQCDETQFSTEVSGGANLCPVDTVVGVASVTAVVPHLVGLQTFDVPVFNLIPERGEPARFGFDVEHALVTITA
jgi:hypothetical protein